jgi:hypothetical protein
MSQLVEITIPTASRRYNHFSDTFLKALMVLSQPANLRSARQIIVRDFPSAATITISVTVEEKRCLRLISPLSITGKLNRHFHYAGMYNSWYGDFHHTTA